MFEFFKEKLNIAFIQTEYQKISMHTYFAYSFHVYFSNWLVIMDNIIVFDTKYMIWARSFWRTNYRPISILSRFAKVLKYFINAQFPKKHNMIYKAQYRFQKGISSGHAILDVATNSSNNTNHNLFTALIFLDLHKAFNTISNGILLHELNHYSILGPALQLMNVFFKQNNMYAWKAPILKLCWMRLALHRFHTWPTSILVIFLTLQNILVYAVMIVVL